MRSFDSWESYGTYAIERDTNEYLSEFNENEQELKKQYAEEEAEERFLCDY